MLLGYLERRPWLWLVDLDARAIAPATTALPGNDVAVNAMCTREDWLAVQTHSVLWSVPLGLDGPGRRLRESFTFVPSRDPQAVWVEVRPGHRRSVVAINRRGQEVNRLELPDGWRLHAETQSHCVIENVDEALLATFDRGKVQLLANGVEALNATSKAMVAWTRRDDDGVLGVTNVLTRQTHEIRHPDVSKWQRFGTFSPDGSYLAVGGFRDPPGPPSTSSRRAMAEPYRGRRAVMALVHSNGRSNLVEGEYDNFAWTPTWSRDNSWVVFGAPFQGRRLYAFRPEQSVLHALSFRRQPPMPMLDVTGQLTVPDAD